MDEFLIDEDYKYYCPFKDAMCYDIDECDNIECKIREDFKKVMEDKK
jgi:hypothetical protein